MALKVGVIGIFLVYLALFAASAAGISPAYNFTSPKLPKPDFQFAFYAHGNLITPTNRTSFAVTVPVAKVGFARGIYVFVKNVGAENQHNGIERLFTAIFNNDSGLANSTLCFKGWDYFPDSVLGNTELAICGGTGKFRKAQGFSRISIARIDAVSAALKFDVFLFF
ncbi:hypothetical protein R1sor_019172 [Riccia sorocarpa]|uniref:Dirigent protein n=1 Tax=Riccia sorocarpa TaxID=122646 RepID=A0ABD3IFJ6_9MARC